MNGYQTLFEHYDSSVVGIGARSTFSLFSRASRRGLVEISNKWFWLDSFQRPLMQWLVHIWQVKMTTKRNKYCMTIKPIEIYELITTSTWSPRLLLLYLNFSDTTVKLKSQRWPCGSIMSYKRVLICLHYCLLFIPDGRPWLAKHPSPLLLSKCRSFYPMRCVTRKFILWPKRTRVENMENIIICYSHH